MSSWSLLPQEAIEQIFSHLDSRRKDLIEYQITCRNWSTAAQAQIYNNVDLYEIILKGESKLISFFYTVANSPSSPVNFVKSLSLDSRVIDKLLDSENVYPPPANCAYYTNLGILVPNLEIFCAYNGGRNSLVWDKILHERYNNHWTHLKEIPEIDLFKNQAYYSCAALACRESLESLSLHHTTHTTYETEVQVHYNILVQGLQHFTSLTNLGIMADQSNITSLYPFDSVIEKCSKIKSLLFGSEVVDYGSLTATTARTVMDLALVNPRPDIKRFEGWCNKQALSFYEYLKKVPKYALNGDVKRSTNSGLSLINSFIQSAKSTNQDIRLKTTYSHRHSSKVNVDICSSKYSDVDKFYGEKIWWFTVDKKNDYVLFGKLMSGETTPDDDVKSNNSNNSNNTLKNFYLQHIITTREGL